MRELKLKVCGMRERQNICAVAELSPDYIGFVFVASSPRDATGVVGPEIIAALPSETTSVGVFQDAPPELLCETVSALGLKAIQLHGREDARYMAGLREVLPGVTLIKAVSVSGTDDVANIPDGGDLVDLYLLDGSAGGSGVPFDWSCLEEYQAATPFLLAGGIGLENEAEALAAARSCEQCVGLDVNSRLETRPGAKNVEMVRKFKKRMAL